MARLLDKNGYWREDGVLVHRHVWSAAFGPPPKGWVVHHCDGSKVNNDLDNLVALPSAYHDQIHAAQWRDKLPLPRREELLIYYHGARQRLDDLMAQWRDLYALLAELEFLGVDISRRPKGLKKKKKKKKKKDPRLTMWLTGKKKRKAPLTVGSMAGDQARLKEIQKLRKAETDARLQRTKR